MNDDALSRSQLCRTESVALKRALQLEISKNVRLVDCATKKICGPTKKSQKYPQKNQPGESDSPKCVPILDPSTNTNGH